MDWGQAMANGFATGIGVIFAQKIVSWIDKHQITKDVKRVVNGVTKNR